MPISLPLSLQVDIWRRPIRRHLDTAEPINVIGEELIWTTGENTFLSAIKDRVSPKLLGVSHLLPTCGKSLLQNEAFSLEKISWDLKIEKSLVVTFDSSFQPIRFPSPFISFSILLINLFLYKLVWIGLQSFSTKSILRH